MSNLLDAIKERIVVFDGAMGTNLQVQNLTLDDFGGPRFEGCNENLLVTRPDAVEKVHAGFLDVGCDVIETNSFNGTPVDFAEYGIADQAYDMNVRAARLAEQSVHCIQPRRHRFHAALPPALPRQGIDVKPNGSITNPKLLSVEMTLIELQAETWFVRVADPPSLGL